jgi:hypothetical protein
MHKYSKNDSSSGGNIEDVEQQGLEPILSHEAELTHPLASFGRSRFSFFLKGGVFSFQRRDKVSATLHPLASRAV